METTAGLELPRAFLWAQSGSLNLYYHYSQLLKKEKPVTTVIPGSKVIFSLSFFPPNYGHLKGVSTQDIQKPEKC